MSVRLVPLVVVAALLAVACGEQARTPTPVALPEPSLAAPAGSPSPGALSPSILSPMPAPTTPLEPPPWERRPPEPPAVAPEGDPGAGTAHLYAAIPTDRYLVLYHEDFVDPRQVGFRRSGSYAIVDLLEGWIGYVPLVLPPDQQ